MFQVPNDVILVVDDVLDNIAYRDKACQLFFVHYRKMTDIFIRHNLHAFVDLCVEGNEDRIFRHDVSNAGFS